MTIVFEDGQVIIQIPKAILVLTRQQFIEALKRGKRYRRHETLAKRLQAAAQPPERESI
jgi:hypothetical protein